MISLMNNFLNNKTKCYFIFQCTASAISFIMVDSVSIIVPVTITEAPAITFSFTISGLDKPPPIIKGMFKTSFKPL